MDDIQLTVKAIAGQMGESIESLAKHCGINPVHLKNVHLGITKMTAEDLKRLSKYSGIPADNIKI